LTRFLLIRHADHAAIGHYLAGRAPGLHLSELGRRQVDAVVAALRAVRLTAVVSSPLERTRETAEPISRDHALKLTIVDDVTEFEVGDWTGRKFADLDGDPAWPRFNELRSVTRPPAGELMVEVQARSIAAILRLYEQYPGGTVAVVFHGDVIRAVLLYLLGMPIDLLHRLEISPARISIIEIDSGQVRVLQVNGDTATPAV
jgi:broad specificity phosphatase PhoE